MNLAEAAANRALIARVAALEHEVANLKQIIEALTTGPSNPLKDNQTLRLKKSG